MHHFLMPLLGALLMLLVLLDVFLTVLYARIGTGFISHQLACVVWRIFRGGSRPFTRQRDKVLSFAGPITLVLLVVVWFIGLVCGAGMIIQPGLGTSMRASDRDTPIDFVTAVAVAGDSMTTVGGTDIAPKTAFARLFQFVIAFLGILVLTLSVTYFLEVYNSLQRRNTFAMKLHMMTSGTGDAAELVAGLGSTGKFDVGYTHLAEMAAEMVAFEESHHFYSVLLYFRFREPHYALSRLALVTLDAVTLLKSALDDREYAWLKEAAGVTQLWRSTMQMLTLLAISFLPRGLPKNDDEQIDPDVQRRWRQRYFAACRRLREANIKTMPDENAGAEIYISLRAKWDRYITSFAEHMAHNLSVVDPASHTPEEAESRPAFATRLRSAE
jgi:hypothetical protein